MACMSFDRENDTAGICKSSSHDVDGLSCFESSYHPFSYRNNDSRAACRRKVAFYTRPLITEAEEGISRTFAALDLANDISGGCSRPSYDFDGVATNSPTNKSRGEQLPYKQVSTTTSTTIADEDVEMLDASGVMSSDSISYYDAARSSPSILKRLSGWFTSKSPDRSACSPTTKDGDRFPEAQKKSLDASKTEINLNGSNSSPSAARSDSQRAETVDVLKNIEPSGILSSTPPRPHHQLHKLQNVPSADTRLAVLKQNAEGGVVAYGPMMEEPSSSWTETLPYFINAYVQLCVNLGLVCMMFYGIWAFFSAIQSDINSKVQIKSSQMREDVSNCYRHYRENNSWEQCMNQNPEMVAERSQLSAQTLGEIVNTFLEQLSWKSVAMISVFFLLVFVGSNWAFSMAKRRPLPFVKKTRKAANASESLPPTIYPYAMPPAGYGFPMYCDPRMQQPQHQPALSCGAPRDLSASYYATSSPFLNEDQELRYRSMSTAR